MKRILILALCISAGVSLQAQASYIVEQLGRNAHQIVQSLGAFVGNERAESQSFDITFMPSGNNVEGRMIINTADYRCTFRMTVPSRGNKESECYKIELIVRDPDFQREYDQLFQVYKSEGNEKLRMMHFGDKLLRIEEDMTRANARYRTFIITEEKK